MTAHDTETSLKAQREQLRAKPQTAASLPPPLPPRPPVRQLMDDPDYSAAYLNLSALQDRAHAIEQQIAAAVQAEKPLPPDTGAMALVVGAAGLRAGLDFREAETPGKGDVADLSRELTTVRRAIELQRAAVERLRTAVSERIVGGVMPDYRRTVSRIANAARELLAAARVEVEIRQPLYLNDVSLGDLYPMPLPDVVVERLEHFLSEAESSGMSAK